MNKLCSKRSGFTVIELTLSIALLTSVTMMALVSFIGIFGIYNKAQSLTRTQEESRGAMDQLTRDLRQTYYVDYYAGRLSPNAALPASRRPVAAANTNPAVTPMPATSLTNMKDFYCLTSAAGDFQVGYALLYRASTKSFNLVRSKSCADYSTAEQVVGLDVWNDKGNAVPDATLGTNLASDPDLPDDRRPIVIGLIPGTDPRVWTVRVTSYRGGTIPGSVTFDLDRFGAQTTLESVVTTRQ